MIVASPLEIRDDAPSSGGSHLRRLIVSAASALVIVGGGLVWRAVASPPAVLPPPTQIVQAPRDPALNELIEATRALEVSQQQAIDDLQILQDRLATQQADARRSSEKVAELNQRLEGLQKSFASLSGPRVADAGAAEPETVRKSTVHTRHIARRARARHATEGSKTQRIALRGR